MLLLPVLAAASACGTGPRKDFDEGVAVHFILFREKPPAKDMRMRPIFTVGSSMARAPEVVFGPDHALAVGTAVVNATRGKKTRISFWDPLTRTGSRETFTLDHELWILINVGEPGPGKPAPMTVYDYPPNQELQEWVPLVRFPD
jgi:hypothetical protein